MYETSVLELNKSALQSNLRFLKENISGKAKISSVVKGNAYGHGIEEFVPIVQECGIDHFSVFSAAEAYRVFNTAKGSPCIMIMGHVEEGLEWAIEHGLEFFVFENERLHRALEIAKKCNKPAGIHIELETGMNRSGLIKKELTHAIKTIKAHPEQLRVKGLCTHFAGAESVANHVRIKGQFKKYKQQCRRLAKHGILPELQHTACSAAAMTYPETQLDLARIGIMQYGLWPSQETLIKYISKQKEMTDPLHRVLNWKSRVMSTKEVKRGEFIGYGTTYLADCNMKIALVPVGYAYGYNRSLSNQGRVLVNGSRVSVVGIVNMNMLTIDITNIPETKKGDEVVLIGKQGDLAITVSSFSELSDTLNYELLTRLPESIPRVIVD